MLNIIYNFLFIVCCGDPEIERLQLRITDCIDEKRNLVDTGFINNKSSYTLQLSNIDQYWCLSLFLHIGEISETMECRSSNTKLVKCCEKIVIGDCNNVFLLENNDNMPFYPVGWNNKMEVEDNTNHHFLFGREYTRPYFVSIYETFPKYQKTKSSMSESLKSTRKKYFRKALGISGAGIITTEFKFIFELIVHDEQYDALKLITFETEPFGLNENAEGDLVINNPIVRKHCLGYRV
ncbi:hypothetical protein CDIK_4036 [Cucumispora dikerogammari]|nr:hypothetical protein CDIK_4036 [Cucumispora dikerogammari]